MSVANDEKEAYVLPADADPEQVDSIIRVEEFEGEIDDLREGITNGTGPAPVEDVDPESQEPPDNQFHCPAPDCEAVNSGFPDQCHDCGTLYSWPSEEVA